MSWTEIILLVCLAVSWFSAIACAWSAYNWKRLYYKAENRATKAIIELDLAHCKLYEPRSGKPKQSDDWPDEIEL